MNRWNKQHNFKINYFLFRLFQYGWLLIEPRQRHWKYVRSFQGEFLSPNVLFIFSNVQNTIMNRMDQYWQIGCVIHFGNYCPYQALVPEQDTVRKVGTWTRNYFNPSLTPIRGSLASLTSVPVLSLSSAQYEGGFKRRDSRNSKYVF